MKNTPRRLSAARVKQLRKTASLNPVVSVFAFLILAVVVYFKLSGDPISLVDAGVIGTLVTLLIASMKAK